MNFSRRDFLKSTGLAVGASLLPAWTVDAEAAEVAKVDKTKLADAALARAKKLGATYADIRINRYRNESIFARERQVQNISRTQSFGFGLRVLVKGAWGFAASYVMTPEAVHQTVEQAVSIAKASAAFQRKSVLLAPVPKVVTQWKSAFEKDPFDVRADKKIEFLLKVNEAA